MANNKQDNYKQELSTAIDLARIATEAILDIYYGQMQTSFKADKTPVTNADILANEIILDGLHKTFPWDGIVSEELNDVEGQRVWYIDPIDGTRGFTERNDQFAIHIGLAVEHKPVLGVVYKPVSGEYFYGVHGQGAYRVSPKGVETKLAVRNITDYNSLDLIIDKSTMRDKEWNEIFKLMHIEKVMVSGSEGLRVMKVAEGIADLHLLEGKDKCSTWDICAPQAIVEEAGAYVRFVDGSPLTYYGQRKLGKQFVVAANQELGEYACKILRERM